MEQPQNTTAKPFLQHWIDGIRALGVSALSAFDIRVAEYRTATDIRQLRLASDQRITQLLPLLDDDQQRLLVLMVSCFNPLFARELSLRSGKLDIDRLTLMPLEMQQVAMGLIGAYFREAEADKNRAKAS